MNLMLPLEAASTDLNGPWEFLSLLNLTDSSQHWFDSASATKPFRIYRAVKWEQPPPLESAANFRLIDQTGVSRELNYPFRDPAVRALVLIFTGNGCAKIEEMIPTIKALKTRFASQGVLFWMIDANTGDTRSNILAEATARGMTWPVLHDRAQLVAREFGIHTTPEVVALSKSAYNWATYDRTVQRETWKAMQNTLNEQCFVVYLPVQIVKVPVRDRFGNVAPNIIPHRVLWNIERVYVKPRA